jgi:hypothetical protein
MSDRAKRVAKARASYAALHGLGAKDTFSRLLDEMRNSQHEGGWEGGSTTATQRPWHGQHAPTGPNQALPSEVGKRVLAPRDGHMIALGGNKGETATGAQGGVSKYAGQKCTQR